MHHVDRQVHRCDQVAFEPLAHAIRAGTKLLIAMVFSVGEFTWHSATTKRRKEYPARNKPCGRVSHEHLCGGWSDVARATSCTQHTNWSRSIHHPIRVPV